jgi:hypothetical protein
LEVANGQTWGEGASEEITSFDPANVKLYTLGQIKEIL